MPASISTSSFTLLRSCFWYSTWSCCFFTPGPSSPIVHNLCCPTIFAGRCSGKCWFFSLPWLWLMCMPGGKGCFDGAETSRECVCDPAGYPGQLGAQEQPLADAVRDGLLRDRADGRRCLAT